MDQNKSNQDESRKSKRKRQGAPDNGPAGGSESRTLSKRQRVPVQKFQFMDDENFNMSPKSDTKIEKSLLFDKGTFLAVRNEEEGFYICRAQQNVYKPSKGFKIQWLSNEANAGVYKLDYADSTELECVLCSVTLTHAGKEAYKIPTSQEKHVKNVLRKALHAEKGLPLPDSSDEDSESRPDEEEEVDKPPAAKKSKPDTTKQSKNRTPTSVTKRPSQVKVNLKVEKPKPSTPKAKSANTPKAKATVTPKSKASSTPKAKPLRGSVDKTTPKSASKEIKKGPDRHLSPNSRIAVVNKEPFFETREDTPFISKFVCSKQLIRAVLVNDMDLLEGLLGDPNKVHASDYKRSVHNQMTALHYAIEKCNETAIELLGNDMRGPQLSERLQKSKPQSVLIQVKGTGSYNERALGIPFSRNIKMGRGNREGNNALTKDVAEMTMLVNENGNMCPYIDFAIKCGVPVSIIHALLSVNKSNADWQRRSMYSRIHLAVQNGHRKLAAKLVEEAEKYGGFGFNFLHKEVLLFDREELRSTILAASVRKKPLDNVGMTPLHCAAINPNVKYLTKLLSVEPDFNLLDKHQSRPIHYAAACQSTAPLELLIERGASINDADTHGMTPLHYAVQANRTFNAEFLLKKAKNGGVGMDDASVTKYGVGGINRPNRSSYCPLHIAVDKGLVEMTSHLIKYKADINKPLSARLDRATPLMISACKGHLDIARLLVQNGATIEQTDKMKRTALMLAVMNGNTHVASYLLRMGSDHNHCDSSGNSVVHYAAAYGWYHCLKLLIEMARADPNKPNDWKMTPIAIAFLKGHIGLVDYLLIQKGVDINFKDDKGMTLVSIAAASALVPGLYSQMVYLIQTTSADCTTIDIDGNNALHHLAHNNVKSYKSNGADTDGSPLSSEKMEISLKVAQLLIENHCDVTQVNEEGQTPLMLAIEKGNIELCKLLVEKGSTISSSKNKAGKTVLHLLAEQCMITPMVNLVNMLSEQKTEKVIVASEDGSSDSIPVLEKMDTEEETVEKQPKEEVVNNTSVHDGDEAMDLTIKDKTPEKEVVAPAVTAPVTVNGDIDPPNIDSKSTNGAKANVTKIVETEVILGRDVLRDMAQQVDHDGFTPLLRACAVYQDCQTLIEEPNRTNRLLTLGRLISGDFLTKINEASTNEVTGNDEKARDVWQYGRDFIKCLIELADADINDRVQQKHFIGHMPVDEQKQYTAEGKWSALHFLVKCQNEISVGDAEDTKVTCPAVKLLLNYSPHLELTSLDHQTPLIQAINANNNMAVELLLSAGANANFTYVDKDNNKTVPLLLAARNSKMTARVLEKLLLTGAKVDVRDETSDCTALHYVITSAESPASKLEKLKVLIEGGASINAVDSNGRSVLHVAINQNTGHSDASLDIEEFLIEKNAAFMKDTLGRTPLHYAFTKIDNPEDSSRLDPIELCGLLTSAMKGSHIDDPDKWGRTALHHAAFRGATFSCMHLLQRHSDVNKKDTNGNTPLSLAVLKKHDSCAIILLQNGAHIRENIVEVTHDTAGEDKKIHVWKWRPIKMIDKVPPKEYSIFQGTISNELQGLDHMMLYMGMDSSNMDYISAVEAALCVKKYHFSLRLLKRIHDDQQLRTWVNKDHQTLVHALILNADPTVDIDLQIKVMDILYARGVPLDSKDSYSCTPLIYAALKHNYRLGYYILDYVKNIAVNHKDNYGRDAMAATFWNIRELHGGKQDVKDWLSTLQSRGCSLDLLCDYPGPDSLLFGFSIDSHLENYFQAYPDCVTSHLIVAIRNCEFDLVQFMLRHGASANFSDSKGITPLMHAVKMNDILMVKLLLNYDYNPDAVTKPALKPELTRKLSRQLFALQADIAQNPVASVSVTQKVHNDTSDAESADTDFLNDEDDEDYDDDEDGEGGSDDSEAGGAEKKSKTSKLAIQERKKLQKASSELQYEEMEKTSDVNLGMTDAQGWNVIHHLVCPLEYGSYDNVNILRTLASVGTPLQTRDHSGLSPLEYCLLRGTPKLAAALQELVEIESDKLDKLIFTVWDVADGIQWGTPTPDVAADAEDMLNKLQNKEDDVTSDKVMLFPDYRCNIRDTGEVVMDHLHNMPYDAILSKVDVTSGPWGLFNFYRIQLVRQKGKDLYVLFTCWGRIGDEGQYQHTPFQSRDEGIKEFTKLFKSKTGNDWNDYKKFKNFPKKHCLVPREQVQQRSPMKGVTIDLSTSLTSILPQGLQNLLSLITSPACLKEALAGSGLDVRAMPLGRIRKEAVLEARDILQHIATLVKLVEELGEHGKDDHYQENMEKVARLSNDYYRLIPKSNYEFERIQPISDEESLKTELKFISDLLEYEVVSQILLGAQKHAKERNPLDYVYQSLGCKLELMKEDQIESQYILKYIYNSCTTCKVEAIFKVCRTGEDDALTRKNLSDHRLLWHGSGVANFVSILKHGLMVAAPTGGKVYSRGMYFADSFNKSKGYCRNSSNSSNLMLLCQVALGKIKVDDCGEDDQGDTDHDSVLMLGRKAPDPTFDVTLPYGAIIPLGPLVLNPKSKSYLHNSEYIVHDPAQVCLRYLVQFAT